MNWIRRELFPQTGLSPCGFFGLISYLRMPGRNRGRLEVRKSVPFCFSLGIFACYVIFLAPTLDTPDGPELIAAAFTLGVAHSPGYVLYLLVGKLFSFLPLGNLAWRFNLMSAVFASLTVGLVYLVICKLWELAQGQPPSVHASRLDRPMVSGATLILAVSPTFWIFALRTEVYTANAFLLLLGVLSLLSWRVAARSLSLISFLSGLLLAFHTANLIYLGAFAFLGAVLLKKRGFCTSPHQGVDGHFLWRDGIAKSLQLVSASLFFLLGFSAVLYLLVRSAFLPPVSFGEIASLKDFYQTLTGKIYMEELPYFAIPWTERLYNIRYAFSYINYEFGLIPALLGVVGLGFLGKRLPLVALFLLLLTVAHVAFWGSSDLGASSMGPFPSHMFINAYVLYALFIGMGGLGLLHWLENRDPALRLSRFRIAIPLLVLLSPAYLFLESYEDHPGSQDDQDSQVYRFYEKGEEGLESLESPSIFLCSNANNGLFFFWYFSMVEGRWPGVKAVLIAPFFKTSLERTLKDPNNRQILERLKGRTFKNRRDLRLAIIGELVRANDGKLPFYANISDDYIPSGYAKIQRGGVYEVRKGIDIQELIVEKPQMDHSIGVKYGNAIELVGYNLDQEALKRRSHFRITYFWRALHGVAADYRIAVLIASEKGEILTAPFSRSLFHVPAYEAFPTSRWPAGKVIREGYELFSYGGLKPGRYWINVGVGEGKALLPVTEGRVPVEGRFARIGRFEVLP